VKSSLTLQSRQTFDLVKTMLDKGLDCVTKDDELILHSEQSCHYRMPQYSNMLKNNKIKQNMSRKEIGMIMQL